MRLQVQTIKRMCQEREENCLVANVSFLKGTLTDLTESEYHACRVCDGCHFLTPFIHYTFLSFSF